VFVPTFLFAQANKVARVIDGNTFMMATGEKVRAIGINAPALNAPFGVEAKQHFQKLIEGELVVLTADNLSPNKDSDSSILRYVYINTKDMDEQMLLDGFAATWLKYPFVKSSDYRQAQLLAQNLGFGMWHVAPAAHSKLDSADHTHVAGIVPVNKYPFLSYLKQYFVAGLLLVLVFFGVYTYFKK